MNLLFLLTFLFLFAQQTNCLKFLFYNPKSLRSRVIHINKFVEVLADAGHEVVVYMPEVTKGFGTSLNPKGVRVIERPLDYDPGVAAENLGISNPWEVDENLSAIWGSLRSIFRHFAKTCDYQLKDEKLLIQLRNEKFDLGLTEFYDTCGLGLFEKIGLKRTIVSHVTSMDIFNGILGIPNMVSFNPAVFAPEALPISFWGRVKAQMFHTFATPYIYRTMFAPMQETYDRNGINATFYELAGRASYWFTNTDELVNFPSPISHKVVDVAGVGLEKIVKQSGKLNKKLQSIFDNSTNGVVVLSFGSVAKSSLMPQRAKQAFVDAFKAFPHITFIWKYESPDDGTVEKLPNLHLLKWLPQMDVLARKKVIAYFSHAGTSSLTEACFFGIPQVLIPLVTDSPRNAMSLEYRKAGIIISKHNVTKHSILEALHAVIHDKRYYNNAKELARMISEKPLKVDERVLKHCEFAAKFNVAEQLDIAGRKLSTIEFYNLDAFAIIFIGITFVIYLLYKAIFVIAFLGWTLVSYGFEKKKCD